MRIASFDGGRIGVVEGENIVDVSHLAGEPAGQWPPVGMVRFIADFAGLKPSIEALLDSDAPRIPLASVRLETPVAWPNKVVAFPSNYHEHVEEMKGVGAGVISTFKANGQGFFLKSSSSLSGPHDPIVLPQVRDREVHHECELALVIGKGGRGIRREDALEHVFGYACLVDVVVRGKEERVMRKSYDSFCPVGPYMTTADEVADPCNIEIALSVNGKLRQKANTRDLIVDIPEMIAMASAVMTLQPGDIIATGTPAGVAPIRDGDSLSISASGIGEMVLEVVQGDAGWHEVWNKPAA